MVKHKIARLSILLLVLLLAINISFVGAANDTLKLAPVNPDYINYIINGQASSHVPGDKVGGYRPSLLSMAHLKGNPNAAPIVGALSATYDLRTLGKVTPVKDQGSAGSCWTFGTYGSMESCLLPGENCDFSENNLKNTHGFDIAHDAGGNATMSAAYLARWSGPVNESSDPYNPLSGVSPSGLAPVKHVQKVAFLPLKASATDNTTLKNALVNYGAVYCAFYWANASYNAATAAYCYTGNSSSNHAVTIVGWDDSYSRSNFARAPRGDGAFIVKNSWGTSWGQNGYFYVSYYDSKFGYSENALFFAPESTTNYAKMYSYDPLGWVTSLGYTNSSSAWMANIFTASANQSLQAFSIYTPVLNSTYTVKIYTNASSGPVSGTLATTQSGTIADAGYSTITLNSPVALTSGQKFSVVVQLNTPGYSYPIPMEYPYAGYASKATASAGQSYISSTGSTWQDLTSAYANTNVNIKAFAN